MPQQVEYSVTPLPAASLSLPRFIRLSRPRFWIYVLGPYLVGLIAGADTPSDIRSISALVFGLYFLFPANLLIYGVNDIFDYESDRLNPKKTGYEDLVLPTERRALWSIILLTNLPFLVAVPLMVPAAATAALAAFLFFSLFYSAPPIRAKSRPLLDSAFNVLYVFPGVFAFFLIGGGAAFSPALFLAAWFWTMAMHAYSAVPDIEADRQSGMTTVATLLGSRGTLVLCAALYAGAAVLAAGHLSYIALGLGAVYITMMLYSLSRKTPPDLMRVYRWFPLVNTAAGATLFFAAALMKFPVSLLLSELL